MGRAAAETAHSEFTHTGSFKVSVVLPTFSLFHMIFFSTSLCSFPFLLNEIKTIQNVLQKLREPGAKNMLQACNVYFIQNVFSYIYRPI